MPSLYKEFSGCIYKKFLLHFDILIKLIVQKKNKTKTTKETNKNSSNHYLINKLAANTTADRQQYTNTTVW